ncbi:hypothetical protein EKK58_05800 [Candidatus Dependentiae bacterium]|nr:MAG: hypothetical protein EKK58_05800 [Candidatus Dependentiae bacterium]
MKTTIATLASMFVCLAIPACGDTVIMGDSEQWEPPPAECSLSSDCPDPPPESCRQVACDWTGMRTEDGYPRGCFLVVSAPNAYCYWLKGPLTCPGTCSTPDSGSVCQLMEPHCGDYH